MSPERYFKAWERPVKNMLYLVAWSKRELNKSKNHQKKLSDRIIAVVPLCTLIVACVSKDSIFRGRRRLYRKIGALVRETAARDTNFS